MANFSDIQKFKEALKNEMGLNTESNTIRQIMTQFPKIPTNPLVTNVEANRASEFYKRLTKWIAEFDESLEDSHEVGIRLVSFGQTVVFHLESMGYWNPSLISFKGYTEDGNPVELIQHVSQISVLLTKLPRKEPSKPKKPIGFAFEHTPDDKGDDDGI
jgi:hypothetical protein